MQPPVVVARWEATQSQFVYGFVVVSFFVQTLFSKVTKGRRTREDQNNEMSYLHTLSSCSCKVWLAALTAMLFCVWVTTMKYAWTDWHDMKANGHKLEDSSLGSDQVPHWLVVLTLGTPLATGLTFLVVIMSICLHVGADGRLITRERRRVLSVLMLPLLYGTMAFRAVGNAGAMVWLKTYDADRDAASLEVSMRVQGDDYKSNFDTGDLWEAWALFCFGRLALAEVKNKLKIPEKSAFNSIEVHVAIRLTGLLKSITLVGLTSFVITSLISSGYAVFTTVVDTIFSIDVASRLIKPENEAYIFGMGMISSTLAIVSLVKLERTFDQELHEFGGMYKFASVKASVSITYLQNFVIGLVPDSFLTESERKLFYAVLVCYELLGIAVMHKRAWPVHETWLTKARTKITGIICDEKAEALLACDIASDGSFG